LALPIDGDPGYFVEILFRSDKRGTTLKLSSSSSSQISHQERAVTSGDDSALMKDNLRSFTNGFFSPGLIKPSMHRGVLLDVGLKKSSLQIDGDDDGLISAEAMEVVSSSIGIVRYVPRTPDAAGAERGKEDFIV